MEFTMEDLTHYGIFNDIPEIYYDFLFEEWHAHGIDKLILTGIVFDRARNDPAFTESFFRQAERHGISFTDAHVPWTPVWALNTPSQYKDAMLKNNQRALELCGQAGCRTLTIHIGDNICLGDFSLEQGREDLDRTLEILIPIAEKNKVVLCIENIIAPTDQPPELLRCFQKFSSDHFGCCYDSGHANVMAYSPGKDPEKMSSRLRDDLWHGKVEFYKGDALQDLLPYIVTCHLHDNDGFGDQHLLPGKGTISWGEVMAKLKKAPRLISMQTEVALHTQGRISIEASLEAFRRNLFA